MMLRFLFLLTLGLCISARAQTRTIHVFVALCDNVNQGIVPVPAHLGNGQEPTSNLYWGALYGVKTHFKKSKEWILLQSEKEVSEVVLERLLFKHATEDVYLLADAYDGRRIEQCTIDFLTACAGEGTEEITHHDLNLRFAGCADLLAYIGHDGLMDFELEPQFSSVEEENESEAIILACASKSYFSPHLKQTGAYPLVWTSGLMAPEAYTLEWALNAWAADEDRSIIRQRAAEAYHHYQKCGLKGAQRLLVQGW